MLLSALYENDLGVVRYLLKKSPALANWQDPETGNSLAHFMVYSNLIEQFKLLKELGINCILRNKNGETALHWAVKMSSEDLISLLIQSAPAIINMKDNSKSTPLHIAAQLGYVGVINILCEFGANCLVRDCDDLLPYDLACESATDDHVRAAKLLKTKSLAAHQLTCDLKVLRLSKSIPCLSPVMKDRPPSQPVYRPLTQTTKRRSRSPDAVARSQSLSKLPIQVNNDESVDDSDFMRIKLNNPSGPIPFTPVDNEAVSQTLSFRVDDKDVSGSSSGPTSPRIHAKNGIIVVLSVEQCYKCQDHAWCYRHDEHKYNSSADGMLNMCIKALMDSGLPVTVFAYKFPAPQSRISALELVVSVLTPDNNESEPGYNWFHHCLHSKLARKTWPQGRENQIRHDLLQIVSGLVNSMLHRRKIRQTKDYLEIDIRDTNKYDWRLHYDKEMTLQQPKSDDLMREYFDWYQRVKPVVPKFGEDLFLKWQAEENKAAGMAVDVEEESPRNRLSLLNKVKKEIVIKESLTYLSPIFLTSVERPLNMSVFGQDKHHCDPFLTRHAATSPEYFQALVKYQENVLLQFFVFDARPAVVQSEIEDM